jgi:hypothetical protein
MCRLVDSLRSVGNPSETAKRNIVVQKSIRLSMLPLGKAVAVSRFLFCCLSRLVVEAEA